MDDYLKEALEITRAQAGVRVMSEEEIAPFIQKVAQGIRAVAEGEAPLEMDSTEMAQEARKSVKEKSVTCLECGKSFKILTNGILPATACPLPNTARSGASKRTPPWSARPCSANAAKK